MQLTSSGSEEERGKYETQKMLFYGNLKAELRFLISFHLLSTRKKKQRIPVEAMMSPGTIKDIPHAEET